jgi:hypothetical protein
MEQKNPNEAQLKQQQKRIPRREGRLQKQKPVCKSVPFKNVP